MCYGYGRPNVQVYVRPLRRPERCRRRHGPGSGMAEPPAHRLCRGNHRLYFYDPFVLSGTRVDAAEHGHPASPDGVWCLVRIGGGSLSPAGFLRGVTATLSDQLGSTVFYCSGVGLSGISLELSVGVVDAVTVGEEIEVEGKLLRAGKSVGVVSVDLRKKRTGKLLAHARHTKYLVASSRFLCQMHFSRMQRYYSYLECWNFTGNRANPPELISSSSIPNKALSLGDKSSVEI